MTRLNLLLLLAVMASAMALVKASYDNRRLFAEIHRAESEAQHLAGEHTRLEAEREEQATNLRVERTASDKLQMRPMTPAVMLYENATAPAPAPLPATKPVSKPQVRP